MTAPPAPPRSFWRAPFCSPCGLVLRAGLVALLFVVAHVAGWRENTCILCGTSPTGNPGDLLPILLGVLYVLFYFGFVLVVPILLLGAAAQWALLRLFPGAAPQSDAARPVSR